jgi:hypothetical protein
VTGVGATPPGPVEVTQAVAPLPHVAVRCVPGCLALRWLQDARGTTRLTLLVRSSRSSGRPWVEIPTDATDVAGCISFAAAISGIARADAIALGHTPRVIRIPVGASSPPFLAVEIPPNDERGFSIVVAEPWFRSPSATLAALDAFVRSVAGEPECAGVERPALPEVACECADAPADVTAAFGMIQRQAPAVVHGVLPTAYRHVVAQAVAAARAGMRPAAGNA